MKGRDIVIFVSYRICLYLGEEPKGKFCRTCVAEDLNSLPRQRQNETEDVKERHPVWIIRPFEITTGITLEKKNRNLRPQTVIFVPCLRVLIQEGTPVKGLHIRIALCVKDQDPESLTFVCGTFEPYPCLRHVWVIKTLPLPPPPGI